MHTGDFTSLYPAVNSFEDYPVDHPKIICEPEENDSSWFGPIKYKILAPRKFIPVLPCRSDKLLFGLCRKCMDTKQQTPCEHTDEERSLVETWWHNELKTAIEKGTRFLKLTKFTILSTQPRPCSRIT